MAVHDFQDQEEIENFKYLWRKYLRWVFYVLLLLAAAYLGWVVYQNHLQGQVDKATVEFDTFISQSQAGNESGAKKALLSLQQNYAATLPATQATLMMAGTAFDAGKYDEAAAHLHWVQSRQKDDLLQTVVARRLAVVYLQQKKYDEALKALDVKVADAYLPVILETRADVLMAQDKKAEAVLLYQEALKLLPEAAVEREWLQLKINQL